MKGLRVQNATRGRGEALRSLPVVGWTGPESERWSLSAPLPTALEERVLFNHATSRNARTAPAGGFSLVELLVVMAITGVLTALLLPTLATVRENANRVISSSNQRTIGQGLTMYAAD